VAALTAALALASVTSAAAGTTSGASPTLAKPDAVTHNNWTGYVLVGHTEGFGQVTGEFKIPAVVCTSANSKASFWIGLDGYGNGTVEQVGISTDCVNSMPQYRTWWEMYPNSTQYQFYAAPGDTISMLVKYVGGAWNLALTDLTVDNNDHKFNVTEKCPSGHVCENMTAEAVLEADGGKNLSNFKSAGFSEIQAVDSSHVTTGLVANGSVWGLAEVLMTGANGQNLADPGAITGNGQNYTLTYRQAN
jgi:hypothetical protein